ncbi:DUF222 domain-containing protein [Cellulomonas sp. ATA003]|uniref:DUF222 domain-containing protein n=1 Tax=Cellulomonas sp. ATA003 TaxID=3073064 RepID=UPI0028737BCB|nr:DUF222 domain-containing protein [Cellulomonas sp. ATA003]WNB86617.1 DUF222 domain-containing protein [Cellulomonas sp. ATA003]
MSFLAGLDLSVLEGREAAVVARRLAEVTSRAGVAKVRLLPVIDDDGVWALSGARSFPVWLSHDHRLSVGVARAQVRLGRTLRDHLPATAAAAVAGEVTVEQAQVIATLAPTSDQRRELLADPEHECNETLVVEQARQLSVDETRVFVPTGPPTPTPTPTTAGTWTRATANAWTSPASVTGTGSRGSSPRSTGRRSRPPSPQ